MKRTFVLFMLVWCAVLMPVAAQDALTANVITLINVRANPDVDATLIGTLEAGQTVSLEARNRFGDWALVRSDALRGWVASRYLTWPNKATTLMTLPTSEEGVDVNVSSAGAESGVIVPQNAALMEGAVSGTSSAVLNVRVSPTRSSTPLTQLPSGAGFTIEARNDSGDWLLINTGSVRGWVAAAYVRSDTDAASLPVSSEIIGQAVVSGSPASVALTEGDAAIVAQLQATPIIAGISANAIAIYQRGISGGRNPNYFMKIGDSNSASLGYLGLLGTGAYNLGAYSSLQPTIDFFKQRGNSWLELSQVAQTGNLTTTIIDPIFTETGRCSSDESPLVCEIRLQNPAIALIYLGAADNQRIDAGTYREALRQIVQRCISENVLPILTTIPTRPHPTRSESYGLAFNAAIMQVAAEFDIPLLNMWAATRGLPDEGMQGDLLHFTITPNYRFVDFRGDERQTGYTAWNLGALQMLDAVRRAVGG